MKRSEPKSAAISQPTIYYRGKWLVLPAADKLAAKYCRRDNYREAEEICRLILAKFPQRWTAHHYLSFILLRAGRFEEALASCEEALTLRPDFPEALRRQGRILQSLTRYEEALASFDRCLTLQPDHSETHLLRSILLMKSRRFEEALASCDRALIHRPDHAEAYCERGHLLVIKGDMPEAEKMFRQALALKADLAEALESLAGIHHYQNLDHPDIRNIQILLRKTGISPMNKQSLLFAAGKIYDDCSHYDEAFGYFQEANELQKKAFPYDSEGTARTTDAIMEVFSREFLAGPFPFSLQTSLPLFVVGMPRSGTTLLASILSNHPFMATAGEGLDMEAFSLRLGKLEKKGLAYPEMVRNLPPPIASGFIQDYLEKLNRNRASDVRHVIDKYPLNFRHLGLIAMLFPNARIIHCTRDPLDTGISNYFQHFPLFYSYSTDLRNIGHFYGEYLKLMSHWREALPLKMMEISYENMVSSTEQTARATLEWLELDWDPRCLTPHTNPAGIETCSRWQVRQPIYDRSIGRWHHYEKHLQPLMACI